MSAPVIELQQTVNDDSKEYVEQQLFIFKLLFAASNCLVIPNLQSPPRRDLGSTEG
jgi:hypothetical protein